MHTFRFGDHTFLKFEVLEKKRVRLDPVLETPSTKAQTEWRLEAVEIEASVRGCRESHETISSSKGLTKDKSCFGSTTEEKRPSGKLNKGSAGRGKKTEVNFVERNSFFKNKATNLIIRNISLKNYDKCFNFS